MASFADLAARTNARVAARLFDVTVVYDGGQFLARYDSPYGESVGVATRHRSVTVVDAAAALVANGDPVSIDTLDFTVTGREPDGSGFTVLRLLRAS